MKEPSRIRLAILGFWTFFWGLSALDKIIPSVAPDWVGKDFFALFIKFFESLEIKAPLVATFALAGVATTEALIFVLYLLATGSFLRGRLALAEKFFYRATLAAVLLLTLFSVGDNAFGDRAQLLEHGLFWMILVASWAVFRYVAAPAAEAPAPRLRPSSGPLAALLLVGVVGTAATAVAIVRFSGRTFADASAPVPGEEVAEGVYKFNLPFLADRVVFRKTINHFKQTHPDLTVTYIYTGPNELNSKMKTFLLLYVFTRKKG